MLTAIKSGAGAACVDTLFSPSLYPQNDNPIINKVRELTESLHKVPGIAAGAGEQDVQAHRARLLACLDTLDNSGKWDCQQSDNTIRPIAVGLQAIFEQALLSMLDSGDVLKADIIFTTAHPVTPLCHSDALRTTSLLSDNVASHPDSYDTVISRVTTVSALINHPAVNLCAVYATERANPADQAIYNDVCQAHSDGNKFYSLCTGQMLPDELSGASYFVVSKDNTIHLFALRITQANKETDRCVIFTQDKQQNLRALCENYMNDIQLKNPDDQILGRFMALLQQNYA